MSGGLFGTFGELRQKGQNGLSRDGFQISVTDLVTKVAKRVLIIPQGVFFEFIL